MMATTKQDSPAGAWEAEQHALVEAEAERRRLAAERAEDRRRWEAADRARFAELIGPEVDRVVEHWEAERLRVLRQRAEVTAGGRVRGQILHDHAVNLTGPYSAEALAAEGRQAVAVAWPDCPGLKVPKAPDEYWRPAHVKGPWVLTADGVCRRAHQIRKSVPYGTDSVALQVGWIPNKVGRSGPFDYWVCSPVWPLDVGGGAATFAVGTKKGWSVEEIRLGPDIDPLEVLLRRGLVVLNPEPLTWTEVGAMTGDNQPRRIGAQQLFGEFLTEAQRFNSGA
jgi:hypothetical protein